MANRWGNNGNSDRLYILGSKITGHGDWSHEIKRCLFLGRKAMINLDSMLKSRGITFASKGPSSQSYGFSSSHVWMWELDYKKTELWRIDAFELWCWRRQLGVPWTARRSNQSILGDQSWILLGRTDAEVLNILATWWEELTHWKRSRS